MTTLYEELQQLTKLHREGALSDAEFSQAKARAMERDQRRTVDGGAFLQGIGMLVMVGLLALFFFGFFLPKWNDFDKKFNANWAAFDQTFQRHGLTGR